MERSCRIEQRQQLRSEVPPHDTVVVLRGGRATAPKMSMHAERTRQRWTLDGVPLIGISVVCALDPDGPASRDGLLAGLLGNYRLVHQVPARGIVDAGFELLPTSDRPHFTVHIPGDDSLVVARLLAVLGTGSAAGESALQAGQQAREGPQMINIDITADLNGIDETGFAWTYLAEAQQPALIRPGLVVVAGDEDDPFVCEIVDLVEEPSGTIMHLRVLPGRFEDYSNLVHRAELPV